MKRTPAARRGGDGAWIRYGPTVNGADFYIVTDARLERRMSRFSWLGTRPPATTADEMRANGVRLFMTTVLVVVAVMLAHEDLVLVPFVAGIWAFREMTR